MTFYVEVVELRPCFLGNTSYLEIVWSTFCVFAAVKGICVEFAGVCEMF